MLGGIYSIGNRTVLLMSNSQVRRNSAGYGGGISLQYRSTAIILSTEVVENIAVRYYLFRIVNIYIE